MRLKCLRERTRVWTEADVRVLRTAHEYWMQNKLFIITKGMVLDSGVILKQRFNYV